jgi:hypothetical protein
MKMIIIKPALTTGFFKFNNYNNVIKILIHKEAMSILNYVIVNIYVVIYKYFLL